MKRICFLIGLFCLTGLTAQEDEAAKEKALKASRNLTWEANNELSDQDFVGAEANYRRAISKSKDNAAAPYNLGNAYYENESYSEAFGRFKQAGETAAEKGGKHKAYHNMGNVFMKNKEYEKAVEAYKEALRNDPTDEETRYNLALAKEMLKKDQQNQNKDDNEDNKDNKDQKEKNQDQQNQGDDQENKENKQQNDQQKDQGDQGDQGDQQKEQNKKGEGDEKEEKQKQPEQGDQQQQKQPRPNQLSPQQIKNLLEAMQNEEKKVQEKIDAKKVQGVKRKNEKDW
ncbi:tetratricopeptide repeat protein [Flavobacteriaceae bacterium R33]|uniref:Tetratricopeptide repeat protein n=2 Tax=Poritiphilus flavus TaxID=2697053 RepID=A0A6L9ED65_9FLAO|nr:tetratricopeptide repeat protein [Poritiphilus flavus]